MTSGIGYSATGSGEVRDKDGNLLSFECGTIHRRAQYWQEKDQ